MNQHKAKIIAASSRYMTNKRNGGYYRGVKYPALFDFLLLSEQEQKVLVRQFYKTHNELIELNKERGISLRLLLKRTSKFLQS